MKKFLIFIGILFLICCGFLIYDTYKIEKIPILTIENESININKIHIYGTHLNMSGEYSLAEDTELVLYNGNFLVYPIKVKNDGSFQLSEFLNDGVYLDDIPKGKYFLFFRTKYLENDIEKYKYYSLNNTTDYKETTYYTMSTHSKKIIIENEKTYPTMMINVIKVINNDVYDIVIDPGHGGMDCGANKNGHTETEFNMEIANKMKTKLEEHGFKVKLTHEEGQLSKNEKLPEYGSNGRAVIPREVNAKYLFSIHMNSSNYSGINGLEIYTAKNIDHTFTKLLVDNITSESGIKISNNVVNKVDEGIYSRNFTEDDIKNSVNDYKKKGLLPYDITTDTCYYYIIRETGGIMTGAYVDNRNSEIIENPYTKSNVGTETYLLELGYLSNKNDVNNIVNNLDKFVDGITKSIYTLYK